MTNKDILNIAMKQSATDLNCSPEDFLCASNKVVLSVPNSKARKYLKLPFDCNMVSYGNNIVASVRSDIFDIVADYINKYPVEHCFETPNMNVLNDKLSDYGLKICFMAEYFLPDLTYLKKLPCLYETRLLKKEDFSELYIPQWSNALCEKRRELDVFAVGAYDGDNLVGLSGCSADCDDMLQIGVDVLPGYRCRGIAQAITSELALEIIKCGKVPFYCAAWSNIKSVRNAIKSGFRPSWVEMTVKSKDFVDKMNDLS